VNSLHDALQVPYQAMLFLPSNRPGAHQIAPVSGFVRSFVAGKMAIVPQKSYDLLPSPASKGLAQMQSSTA